MAKITNYIPEPSEEYEVDKTSKKSDQQQVLADQQVMDKEEIEMSASSIKYGSTLAAESMMLGDVVKDAFTAPLLERNFG